MSIMPTVARHPESIPGTARATCQDVLDAPAHRVAEIVEGVLHTHPRPAMPHALASSVLGRRIGTASGVRFADGDVSAQGEGRFIRAGLSCFAPSPGGAGSRPLRASIPIAGAPPASHRFAEHSIARAPQGRTDEVLHGPQAARHPFLPLASVKSSCSSLFEEVRGWALSVSNR